MDHHRARALATDAKVGAFATVDATGRIDLVPITYAIDPDPTTDLLVTAVDHHKPKTTEALKRLDNIRRHPEATVLVDNYANDWSKLWWVRIRGICRVVDSGDAHTAAVDLLADKYTQYKKDRPAGPVIRMDITEWLGWSA